MRVIRFAVAAALMMTTATVASAQGGQGQGMTAEQRQQRQNEMLFKGITLTETQKAKVDSIQAAARTANQAMMQRGAMQDSASRATMMEARRKTMADIRAVLTPEQQPVFDKNLEAMPQRGEGRGPGQRPPR